MCRDQGSGLWGSELRRGLRGVQDFARAVWQVWLLFSARFGGSYVWGFALTTRRQGGDGEGEWRCTISIYHMYETAIDKGSRAS